MDAPQGKTFFKISSKSDEKPSPEVAGQPAS
jgi:hypothetical protein